MMIPALVEMELNKIIIDEKRQDQIIVLKEKDGERMLPIVIGYLEASVIKMRLSGVTSPRPLTHDLLKNVIEHLGATVERIVINDLRENTFFATLVLQTNGTRVSVDARPSDAIALAVRTQAPLYAEETVIDRASQWQE